MINKISAKRKVAPTATFFIYTPYHPIPATL